MVTAPREKDDGLGSIPILFVVDKRPLLDTNLLDRPSVGSPDELGLLKMTALFEELPFRDVLPLSESGCYIQGTIKMYK